MIHALLLIGVLLPSLLHAAPLQITVSLLPLQTMVERIGGDNVSARSMVKPGSDPHHYSPTPQQIAQLSHSHLYFQMGIPFEEIWMERIRSTNPGMIVVDLQHEEAHEEAHEPEHESDDHDLVEQEHHESDPHPWTSPVMAMEMAEIITASLVALDPDHQQDYQQNHALFRQQLVDLDQAIRQQLQPLKQRKFMVFHPAWGDFAQTYGLIQVSIEEDGHEPGAQGLATLIRQAREEKIRSILIQPQMSRRAAEQIAAAIDGTIIVMDPLSADYPENLRRLSAHIAENAVQ